MEGSGWHDPIYAQDQEQSDSKIPALRRFTFISPGLVKTMGNRIVAGRDFTWADVYDKRLVAMVSENVARELWRDPSAAIGKRIRESTKGLWREVIGVVGDEHTDGVDVKAASIAYWPLLLDNFEGDGVSAQRGVAYAIRTSRAGSATLIDEARRAIWSVNPDLPVARVRTLAEIYTGSMARTSFTLVMLAMAGGMALLLGVVGIYGVISYSVAQRTREIGIRMALGAQRQALTGMFLGHGLRLAAIGVVLGLAAAAALMRLMTTLLFDVNPVDPLTYGAVALVLIGAAALASYLPALRATTVDPVNALRAE